MIEDPVCGRIVSPGTARATAEHRSSTYLFCSRGRKLAFERDPETCLAGTRLEKMVGSSGVERWACRREDEARPVPLEQLQRGSNVTEPKAA